MDLVRRIRRQDRCAHRATITVATAGIERVVCEACGHVSVHFLSDFTAEADRDRFARPMEREGRHEQADEQSEDRSAIDVFSDAPSGLLVPDPNEEPWWLEPEPERD